jgi:hypothetical protein
MDYKNRSNKCIVRTTIRIIFNRNASKTISFWVRKRVLREVEMGGTCWIREGNLYDVLAGSVRGMAHLEHLSVHGRILLQRFSEKQNARRSAELSLIKILSNGGLL